MDRLEASGLDWILALSCSSFPLIVLRLDQAICENRWGCPGPTIKWRFIRLLTENRGSWWSNGLGPESLSWRSHHTTQLIDHFRSLLSENGEEPHSSPYFFSSCKNYLIGEKLASYLGYDICSTSPPRYGGLLWLPNDGYYFVCSRRFLRSTVLLTFICYFLSVRVPFILFFFNLLASPVQQMH